MMAEKILYALQKTSERGVYLKLNKEEIECYRKVRDNPSIIKSILITEPLWTTDKEDCAEFESADEARAIADGFNIFHRGRLAVYMDEVRVDVKLPNMNDEDVIDAFELSRRLSVGASKINPKHYQSDGMQAIEVIEAFDLGFDLGNAVKYILRAGKKDDTEQELKKAIWYIMHYLGWQPHVNQSMAENFLTNEKIELLKKVQNRVAHSSPTLAKELARQFPLD